jgi:hypothetical protein
MNYSQTLGALKGQEFLQKLDETEKESKLCVCVTCFINTNRFFGRF